MKLDNTFTLQMGFSGGFTVLMAVYHGDDITLFERAVRSVYENTLRPDAFLLVIDGPVSEKMNQSIGKLQESYDFEILRLNENQGLSAALNAGLKKVRTEWIVRADADDFNMPERFAMQASSIRNSKRTLDVVGGAIQEIELDGIKLGIRSTAEKHEDILRFAVSRNPFNHMTVAYRTRLALQCGGYPNIYLKEDYALWAVMIQSGAKMYNIPDVLVLASAGKDMYRRRGGWRYAKSEIALQKLLVNAGLKSIPMALIHCLSRSGVFLMPSVIRGLIYRFILRN